MNPPSRNAVSTAGSSVSGLASVVTSAPSAKPSSSRTARRIRTRSAGGSSVGVPPPKNTVLAGTGSPSTRAARRISAIAASAYDAAAPVSST